MTLHWLLRFEFQFQQLEEFVVEAAFRINQREVMPNSPCTWQRNYLIFSYKFVISWRSYVHQHAHHYPVFSVSSSSQIFLFCSCDYLSQCIFFALLICLKLHNVLRANDLLSQQIRLVFVVNMLSIFIRLVRRLLLVSHD